MIFSGVQCFRYKVLQNATASYRGGFLFVGRLYSIISYTVPLRPCSLPPWSRLTPPDDGAKYRYSRLDGGMRASRPTETVLRPPRIRRTPRICRTQAKHPWADEERPYHALTSDTLSLPQSLRDSSLVRGRRELRSLFLEVTRSQYCLLVFDL